MIALSQIVEAYERISTIAHQTKLIFAPRMSELSGANIYLKQENLQHTGAYKLRGAFNRIALMSEEERSKGVLAASAGNHAQGVAYSARYFGIKAVIIMPESTPLLKVNGVRRLGAEVILSGDNYDEAYAYAQEYAKENDLFFIHPFADDSVIAGQGTVGLEIIRERSDIDTIILPVGGGGLISGVAALYKQMKPSVRIIGVSAYGAPAMYQSFLAKEIQECKSVHTIADGIAVRDVHSKTFQYILESVNEMVCVDDEEIANAVLYLLENQKVVVEGAGAVGVAALLHNKITFKPKENVAIVLSGGNIDVTMLGVIIEKGLLKSQRKMKFSVVLVDKPGSLKKLTDILTQVGANIVQVDYDRTLTDYGDASITIVLETKGGEHQDIIRGELHKHRFEVKELA
ncbi:threonine ammonia-lyase [Helicobacter monodelphidis]|uniref:threonine ammonia-lyase n=1 Tax=Helicobacter sp. 15-1451 TaxID=2004995 RepID=UPI000DCBC385|nr:threonine ammonia-lyase [Helicobacter sp. 15-1451]RAX56823.1 threonine ammonia-lyase [Helicobacter sp. 15-1451]